MKILFLVSSMNAGGAERVAATLCNAWAERGDEVVLVPCFVGGGKQSFYSLSSKVTVKWLQDDLPKQAWLQRIKKISVLRKRILEEKADVVVSFLTNVNIVALMANQGNLTPLIVCERSHPQALRKKWLLSSLRKIYYPKASCILTQTEDAAHAMRLIFPSSHIPIEVIPNPLPENLRKYEVKCSSLDHFKGNLVSMGRMVPSKQFDVLIRCFAKLLPHYPEWHLTIWGDGPERNYLHQLIKDLNIQDKVLLPGKTSDPWGALQQGDAFVMASALEGFPNVLLEAMALGLPTLSFDCPSGPKELTDKGKYGLLVPLGEVEQFILKLSQLLSDSALREQLGKVGRQHVREQYSLEAVIAQWDQIFEKLGVMRE